MTSKYTPGPWLVCPTNSGTFVKSERVAGYLAEVRYCRATQDVKADARLIAAAPDLLEALMQANSQMELAGDCIEAGRISEALLHVCSLSRQRKAAIAKATGEPA